MRKEGGFGSWFSGFGGVDCGAKAAGMELVFACECDPEIAAVYRLNLGTHIIIANVLMLDSGISHPDYPRSKNAEKRRRQDIFGDWWTRAVKRGASPKAFVFSTPKFPHVAIKHDSPPCPEFSNAKAGGKEGLRDIALARKCCEYLMYARPDFYTLENVFGYRKSESWKTIALVLHKLNYRFNYWHVCMADYGVPQTRRRMVVIARRDGLRPMLPPATHDAEPMPALFGGLQRWVSWYEAIVDLIPGLPDSEFAPWQLARLSDELLENILTGSQNRERVVSEMPAMTIVTNHCGRTRAFIADDGITEPMATVRTQATGGTMSRAFIVPGGNASSFDARDTNEPARTVGDVNRIGNMPRAFIANGTPNDNGKTLTIANGDAPIFTQTAGTGSRRALRAAVSGRVVQMTPRCLARFQSFPDWYELPESNSLAARGIGNAVPPLFYQRLAESLL